jgi:hypothetical protein
MRLITLVLMGAFAVSGCSVFQIESPFEDATRTDTASSDYKRNFWMGQATSQYCRPLEGNVRVFSESRARKALALSADLDEVANQENATVSAVVLVIKRFIDVGDLHPDDLDFARFFAEYLADAADINLALTDEQRRVLRVHAARIRTKVDELRVYAAAQAG